MQILGQIWLQFNSPACLRTGRALFRFKPLKIELQPRLQGLLTINTCANCIGGLEECLSNWLNRTKLRPQETAFGQKRSPLAVAQLDRSSHIKVEFALNGLGEFYNVQLRTAK